MSTELDSKYSSMKENKYDNEIINKNEKELVRPYRKYQLSILLMIIVMFSFLYFLHSLNKELNYTLKTHEELVEKLNEENEKYENIVDIANRVEVNYASLYELDKQPNIETIKDIDELYEIMKYIGNPDGISFGLCYKATKDGDKAASFRNNCGGLSPLLMIIETDDGHRFGGYTNIAFTNDEDNFGAKVDEGAFLFSLDTKKKYKVIKPEKAVSNLKGQFPMFGNNDIFIHDNFFTDNQSIVDYPSAYEEDPNAPGTYVLSGGVKKFKIKELEIMTVYISH